MTQPPIMLTDYRARCCGTCKNNISSCIEEVGCKFEEGFKDVFGICMSYEPED